MTLIEDIILDTNKDYTDAVNLKALFEKLHSQEAISGDSTKCIIPLVKEFLQSFIYELLIWLTPIESLDVITCLGDLSVQDTYYGFTIEEKYDS